MTDIAERAGMGLPAVYRYYPNKQSILRELAVRMLERDVELLQRSLPTTLDDSQRQIVAGISEYWHRHRDDPARARLRAAIHADNELSALDLADSRGNAANITAHIAALTGRTDLDALNRQALLLLGLLDSLMRLASIVDPVEAEALVAEYARLFAGALDRPPTP